MEAYIYKADMLCESCGEAKQRQLNETAMNEYAASHSIPEVNLYAESASDYIDKYPSVLAKALGFDPLLGKFDSDNYPAGPYADGGGESDSPQHCAQCGTFLENPLTQDGYEYVAEQLIDFACYGGGDPRVLQTWLRRYGEDLDKAEIGDMLLSTVRTKLTYTGAPI